MLRPGTAAAMLGVTTHTLAQWADAGIIGVVLTPGAHRRYRAADVAQLSAQRHTSAPSTEAGPHTPARPGTAAPQHASPRRGRPLTTDEIAHLAATATIQKWAQLAASYQADGTSIRQIAAGAGIKAATVAARIRRWGAQHTAPPRGLVDEGES